MLKLFIARHGQDNDNAKGILNGRRDETLTDEGREQAKNLASKLKDAQLEFDHAYSSPLIRAKETADIICGILGSPKPETLPLLTERDFGIMTGKEQSKIGKICAPDIIQTDTITYFLNPKGAETFPDLLIRAGKILNKITDKHSEGCILLVTHGDIGKMIYAAYYDLNWKDVLIKFHFGNSELLLLSEDTQPEEAHLFQTLQRNH